MIGRYMLRKCLLMVRALSRHVSEAMSLLDSKGGAAAVGKADQRVKGWQLVLQVRSPFHPPSLPPFLFDKTRSFSTRSPKEAAKGLEIARLTLRFFLSSGMCVCLGGAQDAVRAT